MIRRGQTFFFFCIYVSPRGKPAIPSPSFSFFLCFPFVSFFSSSFLEVSSFVSRTGEGDRVPDLHLCPFVLEGLPPEKLLFSRLREGCLSSSIGGLSLLLLRVSFLPPAFCSATHLQGQDVLSLELCLFFFLISLRLSFFLSRSSVLSSTGVRCWS